MKKFVLTLVFVAAGLVGFNYATSGEFKLIPSFSKSEQQQAVQDLTDRFASANKMAAQAHRQAGMSGIDTTSDVEAARIETGRIQRELKSLQKNLTEDKAIRQAKQLSREMQDFVRSL